MRAMRVVGTVAVLSSIFGIAGISAFWWVQADAMEKNIARLGAPGTISILYDSHRKTGFPFSPGVIYENFRTQVTLGSITIVGTTPKQIIRKKLLTQDYMLENTGQGKLEFRSEGKKWTLNYLPQGTDTVQLSFATPWNFLLQPESSDWKQWLRHISLFEMRCSANSLTTESGELLIKSEPCQVKGHHLSTASVLDIGLHVSPTTTEYTPAYDRIASEIMQATLGSHVFSTSAYGSPVTFSFNGSYRGPHLDALDKSREPITLSITDTRMDTALSNTTLDLQFQHAMHDSLMEGNINLNLQSTVKPGSDQVSAMETTQLLQNPDVVEYLPDSTALSKDELSQIATDITPRYEALSPISLRIEGDYAVNPKQHTFRFNFPHIDTNMAPYGINAKALYNTNPVNDSPKLNTEIHCRACNALFASLANYSERLQLNFKRLAPNGFLNPQLNGLLEQPYHQFIKLGMDQLKMLARDGTKDDWDYHVIQKPNGQTTLNGLPLNGMYGALLNGVTQPAHSRSKAH